MLKRNRNEVYPTEKYGTGKIKKEENLKNIIIQWILLFMIILRKKSDV